MAKYLGVTPGLKLVKSSLKNHLLGLYYQSDIGV